MDTTFKFYVKSKLRFNMQKFHTNAHEQQYSSFDNQAQCNVTKLKEMKSTVQSEDVEE